MLALFSTSNLSFVTPIVCSAQYNCHPVAGKPVATAQLPDGSLLLSDDSANAVYRITYGASALSPAPGLAISTLG